MRRHKNRPAPTAPPRPPPDARVDESSEGSARVADVAADGSRYGKAITKLRARLEQQPGAVPLKVALAEALFRSTFEPPASPVEALRRLNEAIILDPFRPAFYYHRGVQWHRLGNLERALANYARALQFDPGNPRVLHQMALAHLDAGRTDDAHAKWDAAEQLVRQTSRKAGEEKKDAEEAARESGARTPEAGGAPGAGASFDRALFFIQCGRAEAELRAGASDKALEHLRKIKPPPGCASLAGEMALKYLVMTSDAPSVVAWLDESLDAGEGEEVLGYLRPYLNAYQAPAHKEFPLGSERDASRSMRALRALAAFDWARRGDEEAGDGLSALKALVEEEPEDDTLLDAYLALLHDEAARLYEAKEWDEACERWREALLTDRHNHSITHNLALAATRAGEEQEFEKWWDKTQRLWYTRHLILPESESYRRLIAEKHLAFATKSAALAAKWDGDADPLEAVSFWVDEMERYFLSEQYSFASAYHLLGVPSSADDEAIRQAYVVMKSKTARYSDTLPDLKDTLQRSRLKRLEEAYKLVADEAARKAYRPAQDRDEASRAELLRKRKATYIVAVSKLLGEKSKQLPAESADAYARLTKPLLEHPFRALQRLLQNELKAEAGADAAEEIRETLAAFYFDKCLELMGEGSRPDSDDVQKVKRLLKHLHELDPRHWHSLFFRAQLERATGNEKMAVELAREAYDDCSDERAREQINEFIGKAQKGAELQEYLEPAEEHMNRERWAEALPLLQKAIKVSPRMAVLYFYAARCCMGLQRWEEALAYLGQADTISPLQSLIYVLRANCLLHLAVDEISKGRRPRSKKSVADVREVLEEARRCPDYADRADDFKNLEQQLGEVESKLG